MTTYSNNRAFLQGRSSYLGSILTFGVEIAVALELAANGLDAAFPIFNLILEDFRVVIVVS
jgi:hypothetical protein